MIHTNDFVKVDYRVDTVCNCEYCRIGEFLANRLGDWISLSVNYIRLTELIRIV